MKRVLIVLAVIWALSLAAALGLYAQTKRTKPELQKEKEKEQEQERVIIGKELLKAEEAEERRKASGEAGVSPMPAGKYEFNAEELGLVNPKPNALDAALTALCRRYARSDAATRRRMRRSIDGEELYTLWEFAHRAAVFALRERSAERVADGLTALALIERERVDFRDLHRSVGILQYSAEQIGADHKKLFRDAAALAEPGTAEILRTGLTSPAGDRPAGHVVIMTEGGVGFMIWYNPKRHQPTYDLKMAAIDAARLVAADSKYTSVTPLVGFDFTGHLLEADDKDELNRVLASVRASAEVDAFPVQGLRSDDSLYQLQIQLVEMADEQSARMLLNIAQRNKSPYFQTLALREGRLFCLLAAGERADGVKHFETPDSLRRFERGLAAILRRYAAK